MYNEEAFLTYMADNNKTATADHCRYLNALFDMTNGNPPTFEVFNDFMDNVKSTGGGTGLGTLKSAYQALKHYAAYCAETGAHDFADAYEQHIRHAFEQPIRKKMSEFKDKIEYIPNGTKIHPALLTKANLTNNEFVKAFKDLQEIVSSIYTAIEHGSPFDWGWGDWQHLTVGGIFYRRIIATLNMLAHYNELDGDVLLVDRKAFFNWDWNKSEKNKSKTTLIKMAEFGFELEGIDDKSNTFKISCTKNPRVIRVIYSLEQKMEKCGNHMDYRKIQDPDTLPPPANFRTAFDKNILAYNGVEFDGWNAYNFNGKRIARLLNEKNDKSLRLWLTDIFSNETHMREIAAMPNQIKDKFKRRPRKPCPCGEKMCYQNERNEQIIKYTYDGTQYEMCRKNSFVFKDPDMEFIRHYLRLLELEYGISR